MTKERVPCPDCDGLAPYMIAMPAYGDGICSSCHGSGDSLSVGWDRILGTNEERCRECRGTKQCQNCGGNGWVLEHVASDPAGDDYSAPESSKKAIAAPEPTSEPSAASSSGPAESSGRSGSTYSAHSASEGSGYARSIEPAGRLSSRAPAGEGTTLSAGIGLLLLIVVGLAAYFIFRSGTTSAPPVPSSIPQFPKPPLGTLSRSLSVAGCACVAQLARPGGTPDPAHTIFVGDYESRGWINWHGQDVMLRTRQPEQWSAQDLRLHRRTRMYEAGALHLRVEQIESPVQACAGKSECEHTDYDFEVVVQDGATRRTAVARGACGC